MIQAPIEVVPYDSSWVLAFEREKDFLEALLSPFGCGPIEHIGSTSVVGLCAKPVIDVMVGVISLPDSLPAKDALCDAGYQYSEYKMEVMHWFCKPSFAFRTHHLHLVPFESELWNARLTFRDALRADPMWRSEYAALKLDLAQRFRFDREAYTDAKTRSSNECCRERVATRCERRRRPAAVLTTARRELLTGALVVLQKMP